MMPCALRPLIPKPSAKKPQVAVRVAATSQGIERRFIFFLCQHGELFRGLWFLRNKSEITSLALSVAKTSTKAKVTRDEGGKSQSRSQHNAWLSEFCKVNFLSWIVFSCFLLDFFLKDFSFQLNRLLVGVQPSAPARCQSICSGDGSGFVPHCLEGSTKRPKRGKKALECTKDRMV